MRIRIAAYTAIAIATATAAIPLLIHSLTR